jgi:Protein of unknown function (DUF1549)/Protein of unknown function (DUF1553)
MPRLIDGLRGLAMHRRATWIVVMMALTARVVAGGEGPEPADPVDRTAAIVDERLRATSRADEDVARLAALVDRRLAEKWAEDQVEPAGPAGDAEFLRRVTLDIAGRIPSVAEARAFLDDRAPDKRRALVERLLAGPGYPNHFTDVWRSLLVPNLADDFTLKYFSPGLDAWLRRQFAEGAPYDAMVREILTTPLGEGRNPSPLPYRQETRPSPLAFYAANNARPENLAASAARAFLGVRIECAQCHDHPFASWKRDQFWSLAAFFAGVERPKQEDCEIFQGREVPGRRELAISGGSKVVPARFLDGSEPAWRSRSAPRPILADWVVARENPYFARAAANRIWSLFFGTGLVDPVDDLSPQNPPSHPELLDELADGFASHHHDLKFLIRVLTSTRAYQSSSAGYVPGQDEVRLFSRMPSRGMSPEQLYASFVQATGVKREKDTPFSFADSPRSDFLEAFAGQDGRPLERRTSIRQSLMLMNGRLSTDATDLTRGATLPAVADSYFLDTPGKVEALYLSTLTRRPTAEELERLVAYVDRGGPTLDPKKALADVFWSLLNSSEFILNH